MSCIDIRKVVIISYISSANKSIIADRRPLNSPFKWFSKYRFLGGFGVEFVFGCEVWELFSVWLEAIDWGRGAAGGDGGCIGGLKQFKCKLIVKWIIRSQSYLKSVVLYHLKCGFAFMNASLYCRANSVYFCFCSPSNAAHHSPNILVILRFSRWGYLERTTLRCRLQNMRNAFIGRFCDCDAESAKREWKQFRKQMHKYFLFEKSFFHGKRYLGYRRQTALKLQ